MNRILVVSHDAGGANILSSLTKKYQPDFDWTVCVFGPAKNIFPKKVNQRLTISPNPKTKKPETVIKKIKPDLLLTGTSWGSSIEVDYIKAAKKQNIKTASFLDHWINYKARFGDAKNWKKNLPDFIFVGDKSAYKIALINGFPKTRLIQVENAYFEELITESKKHFEEVIKEAEKISKNDKNKDNNDKIKILYLSQPIARYALKKHDDRFYLSNFEYNIVKDLLKIIGEDKSQTVLELKIRLHPVEKTNKYSNLLKDKKYLKIKRNISVSDPRYNSLVKDCIWADIVIGSSSMALILANLIGKKTVSYIPNMKREFILPHKKIKKIKSRDRLIKEIGSIKKNQPFVYTKRNGFKTNKLFKQTINKLINLRAV